MASANPATQILKDVRRDLDDAATWILALTCKGLELVHRPEENREALEAVFTGLLEASAFQDIADQRLAQLDALLTGRVDARPDSDLLNGPASGDTGLDQAAADRLLATPDA
jgi:hypothetical protein